MLVPKIWLNLISNLNLNLNYYLLHLIWYCFLWSWAWSCISFKKNCLLNRFWSRERKKGWQVENIDMWSQTWLTYAIKSTQAIGCVNMKHIFFSSFTNLSVSIQQHFLVWTSTHRLGFYLDHLSIFWFETKQILLLSISNSFELLILFISLKYVVRLVFSYILYSSYL